MVVDEGTNRLVKKPYLIHLAILLAIALGIGIYLIATTVLIAKDGVMYIEQAQRFPSNPIKVTKGSPFGYPFLIYATHELFTLFSDSSSVYSWIHSAQGVCLLCRALSLIPLYFIGKLLVGRGRSFWGLLILIILPYPAEFGSDVIREWPHILFLSTGLLFLICGSRFGKWWMFALTGLMAGLGHTIRPECAQIVIYGILWFFITLFFPRPNVSRLKAGYLVLILLIGFAIPVAPYMKARGKVLPPKLKKLVGCNRPRQSEAIEKEGFDSNAAQYKASALPIDILKALARLAREISDNLMYFFVLPLVVGLYRHFHRLRRILLTERFFIFALMVLYLAMMVLLRIDYDYISRRHCMPIVVFTAFYIPVGLQILARRLSEETSKNRLTEPRDRRRWFFILLAIGLSICTAKFARTTPLRWEKQGYRDAANWLKENTHQDDIIAIPDRRISFYAERKGLGYGTKVPKQAKYIVRIVKDEDEKLQWDRSVQEKYSVWVDKREKKKRIVIYEML